jgi:hypothetical protein
LETQLSKPVRMFKIRLVAFVDMAPPAADVDAVEIDEISRATS